MGFISRAILPACGNMCVCCPALRPSSRRPVKRYKKLLADVFPKTPDSSPNERKIMKLCEYAAKNPFRIPKIAKSLEQRCYKELRCDHIYSIRIIAETYSKLLYVCKEQMAYYASSLLNVIFELFDNKKEVTIQILGCHILAKFIYSQADSTYARNIESLVCKVCLLARQCGEGHINLLRAASLQCLSAMIWFMTEYSQFFSDFDEIIYATLDNCGADEHMEDIDERRESHHHWVDEVVRCEARGGATISSDVNPSDITPRPRLEIKDSSMLTREESECPEVWARICIHKLAELAKESTTLRRVLDPMLVYFDIGRHWTPRHGLALLVLSDISYFLKSTGNEQFTLATIIRHLDHKNVVHDPQVKSDIVQIASTLVQQLRSRAVVTEIGVASDLCRHLRKSLQATLESVGSQELHCNFSLQDSIEDCLLEIAKGIGDARPLFDMMTITLEKLPPFAVVARATIGSLLVLAHIINLADINPHSQLVFPEALLLQLLKAMLHPDVETRIIAHQVFSVVLVRTPNHPRHESVFLYESRKWNSRTTSVFASASALLKKLRREKECLNTDRHGNDLCDDIKEKDMTEEEGMHLIRRSSPNIYKISSIIDRATASTGSMESETNFIVLTEDQTLQLLSSFWIQANQADNLPSNFEAIAQSASLTLLSLRLKTNHSNTVRFFQLCLSLRYASMECNGMMSPSCRRSLFTLATSMLAFAGKIYHLPELIVSLKKVLSCCVDPFLRIGDDLQLYMRPQSNLELYGSNTDQQAATLSLTDLRKIVDETDHSIHDIIVQYLSSITDIEADELSKQLSECFTPEDTPLLGPKPVHDWEIIQDLVVSEESLSLDEDCSRNSSIVDGDLVSESPATDISRFIQRMPIPPPPLPQVISVGQLLESALQVAGQVAGTSVSTSPLPFGMLANQCEALGLGTRKKLSTWLGIGHDSLQENAMLALDGIPSQVGKVNGYGLKQEGSVSMESRLALRLPPASPFDNFLKAARC